jgi:hypothetical protein
MRRLGQPWGRGASMSGRSSGRAVAKFRTVRKFAGRRIGSLTYWRPEQT